MARTLFVILLLSSVSAFAADNLSQEPAALVQARKSYEAKVKAVVDPIKVKYLKQLEEMKKAFGAKGDVASAQAIQREIDGLTNVVTIVGKWKWSEHGDTADFLEDGSCKSSNGVDGGKWICVDKKSRKYQASWTNGYINWIQMSADGTTILLKNNHGQTFTRQRLSPELKQ